MLSNYRSATFAILASLFMATGAGASPEIDYNQNPVNIASGKLCDSDRVLGVIKAVGWLQPPMDLSVRGIDVRVPLRPEVNRQVGSWGDTRTFASGAKKFHAGVDLLGDVGESTLAIADGTIIATGYSNTLGNYVILRGDAIVPPAANCNFDVVYAHLSSVTVQDGQNVVSGAKIGEVGRSGNLSSNIPTHLHLEVWTRPYLSGLSNRRNFTRDPMSIWTW